MHFFILALATLVSLPVSAAQNHLASSSDTGNQAQPVLQEDRSPLIAHFSIPSEGSFQLNLHNFVPQKVPQNRRTFKQDLDRYHAQDLPLVVAITLKDINKYRFDSGFFVYNKLQGQETRLKELNKLLSSSTLSQKQRKAFIDQRYYTKREIESSKRTAWFFVSNPLNSDHFCLAGRSSLVTHFIGRGTSNFKELLIAIDQAKKMPLPSLDNRMTFYMTLAKQYSDLKNGLLALRLYNICLAECTIGTPGVEKYQAQALRKSALIHESFIRTDDNQKDKHLLNAQNCLWEAIMCLGKLHIVPQLDELLRNNLSSEDYLLERDKLKRMVNEKFGNPHAFDEIVTGNTYA